jgi:hypothetical protein
MAHIGAYKFGLGAEVAKFSAQLLSLIVMSTRNNDPGSFTREGQSRGTSNACQCAGNQNNW